MMKRIAPALAKPLLLKAVDSEDVQWLLEFPGDLWGISTPISASDAHGCPASFIWLSASWGDELGRPLDEVMGCGWWALLHPADVAKTASAESGALVSRVRVGNRWRRADGAYLTLEWRALAYDSGLSLSRAMVVDRGGPGFVRDEETGEMEPQKILR